MSAVMRNVTLLLCFYNFGTNYKYFALHTYLKWPIQHEQCKCVYTKASVSMNTDLICC